MFRDLSITNFKNRLVLKTEKLDIVEQRNIWAGRTVALDAHKSTWNIAEESGFSNSNILKYQDK